MQLRHSRLSARRAFLEISAAEEELRLGALDDEIAELAVQAVDGVPSA